MDTLIPLVPSPLCNHDIEDTSKEDLMCIDCKLKVHVDFRLTPKRCMALGSPSNNKVKNDKEKITDKSVDDYPGLPGSTNFVDRVSTI